MLKKRSGLFPQRYGHPFLECIYKMVRINRTFIGVVNSVTDNAGSICIYILWVRIGDGWLREKALRKPDLVICIYRLSLMVRV